MLCGFVVVPTIVGVPVGVNPAAPHSISHIVAVPFSVQPKSAEELVIFVTTKLDGWAHAGGVNSIAPGSGVAALAIP